MGAQNTGTNVPPRRVRPLAALSALLIGCLVGALLPGSPAAHELRPVISHLSLGPDGAVEIGLDVNLEALVAGIGPGHDDTDEAPEAEVYDRLRRLPPGALAEAFAAAAPRLVGGVSLSADGAPVPLSLAGTAIPEIGNPDLARVSRIALAGRLPPGTAALEWRLAPVFGDDVLRLSEAGAPEPFHAVYLAAGERAGPVPIAAPSPRSQGAVFVDYLVVGFEHILPLGLDHILFVVGLFLLSPRLRPLLIQITCFTLAHTLTLALGTLGIVEVPGAVVEPLIAASIVYVAVENLFTDRLHPWRPAVVFGFGLLHGLGFASALGDFGLAGGAFVTGLVAFNIGVELGQLAVIALCFLAVGLWFAGRSWYRRGVVVPASIAIAGIAAFWLVERLGLVA